MHVYISVIHKGSILWLCYLRAEKSPSYLLAVDISYIKLVQNYSSVLPQLSITRADLNKHLNVIISVSVHSVQQNF